VNYAVDRRFSDKFTDAIRHIVGYLLLVPAPFEVDAKQAGDFVVLSSRAGVTVAARVRRQVFAERYPFDFTIRLARDSGTKTEHAKLSEGFGTWMFYGFQAAPDSTDIDLWWLIDLDAWRAHETNGTVSGSRRRARSEEFMAYDIRDYHGKTPRIVVAASDRARQLYRDWLVANARAQLARWEAEGVQRPPWVRR
jgi:hypothetical protein